MRILKKNKFLILLVFITILSGCRETSVPKPKGYFRIDLPKREYVAFDSQRANHKDLPFSFEYPAYGKISPETENANRTRVVKY